MTKYADIDAGTKQIIGFFSPEIHSSIPSTAIEISEERWQDCFANQGKWKGSEDGKSLVLAEVVSLSLEDRRQKLLLQLEGIAFQKLAAPIAQYPPGEQLSWNAKEQEAKDFLATDDLNAAPTLTVEVRAYYTSDLATGVRERSLIILQKAEELKRLSAAVVGARTRLKREIAAMSELDMDGFGVEQALSDIIASALTPS